MNRLALLSLPLLLGASPTFAADLDEPAYVARPAPPPVVERERIIERSYYPAPVYPAPRVYVAPRVVYDVPPPVVVRPYRYAYAGVYPRYRRFDRFYGGYGGGWRHHW